MYKLKNVVDMQWTPADIVSFLLDDGDISSDSSSDSSDDSCPDDVYFPPMKKFRSGQISQLAVDSSLADYEQALNPPVVEGPVAVTSQFRASAQQLSDEEFYEEFRIDRKKVDSLAEKFRESVFYTYQMAGNQKALSAYDHLLVFLWFAGHRATFKTTSEQFGILNSSVYKAIQSVGGFLGSLAGSVIRWPNQEEMRASAEYFRQKGIPFAIGAIAVEDIRIDRRGEEGYFNNEREIYYVPVQIVCDPKKYIRHVYVPQSSDDEASIFDSSALREEIMHQCAHYVVLGDDTYPCLRNLLTPYRHQGEDIENKKKLFNHLFSSARNTVVQSCFKKLKLKFPQLTHCKLRLKPDVSQFITACCVLHNLSLADPFLQNVGSTFQSALRNSLGSGPKPKDGQNVPDDDPIGLAYREDLLTALSIRRNWR